MQKVQREPTAYERAAAKAVAVVPAQPEKTQGTVRRTIARRVLHPRVHVIADAKKNKVESKSKSRQERVRKFEEMEESGPAQFPFADPAKRVASESGQLGADRPADAVVGDPDYVPQAGKPRGPAGGPPVLMPSSLFSVIGATSVSVAGPPALTQGRLRQ